jgi:aminoglycoside 3-N-acetyltransferase I
MEIKKLNENEVEAFINLVQIFKEVFEHKDELPPNNHLSKLLSNPDFLVFVVMLNNKVVGGLTVYVLHRYFGTKPEAYIYDVGISLPYQGQGIGKSLIEAVCKYCKENNFEDAYVEAESDDIDAIKFYSKTSYTSQLKALHFTYLFNDES